MTDIIYERRPVMEVFQSKQRKIIKLWLAKGVTHSTAFEKIIELAKKEGIHYQWADRNLLDELSGRENHQGVVARVSSFSYGDLKDLLSVPPPLPSPIVILDGI